MADLVARLGDCTLWQRRFRPFPTLCRAIIGQQISAKAAATIERRTLQAIGASDFRADRLRRCPEAALRAAGLSRAKVRYLQALAEADRSLDWRALGRREDHAVVQELTRLPGIGPWTAEMFLIFVQQRPDVFSMGDMGLRSSINRLYAGGDRLDVAATRAITERWAPWRSIASWYLWRLVDADLDTWQ